MKWFKKLSRARFLSPSSKKDSRMSETEYNATVKTTTTIASGSTCFLVNNNKSNIRREKTTKAVPKKRTRFNFGKRDNKITTKPNDQYYTYSVKNGNKSNNGSVDFICDSHAICDYNQNLKFVYCDPDDFFQDPIEVQNYRDEIEFLSDWILIDDHHIDGHAQLNNYNSDSDYSNSNNNLSEHDFNDYEKIKRPPSVLSLNSFSDDDDYGLFKSSRSFYEPPPEADYCCTSMLSGDCIEIGQKLDGLKTHLINNLIWFDTSDPKRIVPTDKTSESSMMEVQNCEKFDRAFKLIDYDLDRQGKPKHKQRHVDIFFPLFNSSFIDSHQQRLKKIEQEKRSPTFSIKKYFGLNDYGDIIIHFDHIEVFEGFGYYRKQKVPRGREITEETRLNQYNWQQFMQDIKLLFNGHPRNKSMSGGPGDSIGAYTLTLASDQSSTFARNIENFISCTKDSRETSPQVVMRNMRQFMSGMKNYLVKHGEGDFQREVQRARSRLKSDEFLNLDTILESVMHRLVVLPLREHLYGLLVDFYKRSGDIQQIVDNIKYACQRSATVFGIRDTVTPPTESALREIACILVKLQEAELPIDKLDLLLSAVSAIFESTGAPRGQQLGADDFLPLLVLVVAKTGFYSAEIEVEFMWGLLQPSLLSGEAGYYITALCSAVHALKRFMSSDNEGTGSLDWRSSSLPASSSVLRVIIPDEYNGSLQTRTLPVRPHTTTKDVCRTIAHKAKITNPQDYGLFKLVDGEETLLLDNECPQDVRIAARGKHCILAYKRIDAKIAWPTLTASSF